LKSQQHTLTPLKQLKVRQSGQVRRLRIERLGRLTKSKNSIGSCQPIQKTTKNPKPKPKLTHTFIEQKSGEQQSEVRKDKQAANMPRTS
jgi:hypothetical protein